MASSGCRLLVWNINSLVPTVRNAVLKYGSWRGFFDEHRIDIACFQESKVIEDKLTKELVCVEGYQSCWAISREKKGYSGVTTYGSEAFAPLSYEADCLGAGGEEEDLDREGRVVVTDHEHFMLVNVYVPNAGDRPDRSRLPFKLRWLAALKRKVDALAAAGREVLLVGDFNIPAEPRDIHPTLGPYEDLYSREEQAALQALTDSYTDVWRHLHPEESSTYTVWNEKTSARAFNQGLRIDYVLCTPGLLRRVVSCEVLSSEVLPPKWSDHAGILLELRDLPPLPPHPPCQHWQRLHRRFNPPNRIASLFAGKKRQAEGGASSAAAAAAASPAGSGAAAAKDSKGAGAGQPAATEAQHGAGEAQQQKKARLGSGPPPSSGAAGGSQQSSQLAGSQEAGAAPAEPAGAQQQQAKGSSGGGKQSKRSSKLGVPCRDVAAGRVVHLPGRLPAGWLRSIDRCIFVSFGCSRCGRWSLHMDCGVGYLEEYIKRDKTSSVCVQKYKTLVSKRPKYFFSNEGVKCPRKAGSGVQTVPGSKKSKEKAKVVAGGCPGTCIDADIIKPAKPAPAPLPQPACPAKQPAAAKQQQQQQKEQLPALAGVRRKKGRPPALPTTPLHKPASAAASVGGGRAALAAALSGSAGTPSPAAGKPAARQAGAQAGSSGGAWTGRPPGKPRPPELTLCHDEEECRLFNCPRAHSQAELRQREQEWVEWEAEEEEGYQEEALEAAPESWPSLTGQAEAATEAAAGAAVVPPPVPQPLPLGTAPGAAPGGAAAAWGAPSGAPAGPSFSQMAACQFPAMQECVGALLLMGFPHEAAVAAARAAGADAEAAAALILEQQRAGMWQQQEPAGNVPGDASDEDLVAMLMAVDAGSSEFASRLQPQPEAQALASKHKAASWGALPATTDDTRESGSPWGQAAVEQAIWSAGAEPAASWGSASELGAQGPAATGPWHGGLLGASSPVEASWQQPPVAVHDQLLSLSGTPSSQQQPAAVAQHPAFSFPSDIQHSLGSIPNTPQPGQQQASALATPLGGQLPQPLQPHTPAWGVAGPAGLLPPAPHAGSAYDEGFAAGLRAAQAQAAAAHAPANQAWHQQHANLASHPLSMPSQSGTPLLPIQLPPKAAAAGEDGVLDDLLSLMGIAS